MIKNIPISMKISNNANKVSYTGIPVANYSTGANKDQLQDITIYQLERADRAAIDYLRGKAKREEASIKANPNPDIALLNYCKVLNRTVKNAGKLLEATPEQFARYSDRNGQPLSDESIIYMAVSDREPCGIAIGNTFKIEDDGRITRSIRGKEHETELDKIVTWSPEKSGKISGLGKMLIEQLITRSQELPDTETMYVKHATSNKSPIEHILLGFNFQEPQGNAIRWYESETMYPKELINRLVPDKKDEDEEKGAGPVGAKEIRLHNNPELESSLNTVRSKFHKQEIKSSSSVDVRSFIDIPEQY